MVADWVERIRAQVERYLDFGGSTSGAASSTTWTGPASVSAPRFPAGRREALQRQSHARQGVGQSPPGGPGISFTEFSYQILQAFDYLELHRRYGCSLQTGGSDQWGNLTAGVDLIRRVTRGQRCTRWRRRSSPRPTGTKYGKTESGALWLDPALTSPYAFYQYFLNQDDADIGALLRIFSFRSREEIEALEAETAQRPRRARRSRHWPWS